MSQTRKQYTATERTKGRVAVRNVSSKFDLFKIKREYLLLLICVYMLNKIGLFMNIIQIDTDNLVKSALIHVLFPK